MALAFLHLRGMEPLDIDNLLADAEDDGVDIPPDPVLAQLHDDINDLHLLGAVGMGGDA